MSALSPCHDVANERPTSSKAAVRHGFSHPRVEIDLVSGFTDRPVLPGEETYTSGLRPTVFAGDLHTFRFR